jgi:hypothetical protein
MTPRYFAIILLLVLSSSASFAQELVLDLLRTTKKTAIRNHRSRIEHAFSAAAPSVVKLADARFRKIQKSQTDSASDFTKIQYLFPDYNSKNELLIIVRETPNGGNLHGFLAFRGFRYDGGWFQSPNYEPSETTLIERGVIFRYRDIPPADLDRMEKRLRKGSPQIRELNCYSSFLRFIEDYSNLRLERLYSHLPMYPSEHLKLLLEGKLSNSKGRKYYPEIYDTTKVGFKPFLLSLVPMEEQEIHAASNACSLLIKGQRGVDPHLIPNYRPFFGLTP